MELEFWSRSNITNNCERGDVAGVTNPFIKRYPADKHHDVIANDTGTGPQYLSEHPHLYILSGDLRPSTDTRILKIPPSSSKAFGQRPISYVGPSTWNDLPYSLFILSDII